MNICQAIKRRSKDVCHKTKPYLWSLPIIQYSSTVTSAVQHSCYPTRQRRHGRRKTASFACNPQRRGIRERTPNEPHRSSITIPPSSCQLQYTSRLQKMKVRGHTRSNTTMNTICFSQRKRWIATSKKTVTISNEQRLQDPTTWHAQRSRRYRPFP